MSQTSENFESSLFSDRTEITNMVEDVEIGLPCQVSLNCVQRFQRRTLKCVRQSGK